MSLETPSSELELDEKLNQHLDRLNINNEKDREALKNNGEGFIDSIAQLNFNEAGDVIFLLTNFEGNITHLPSHLSNLKAPKATGDMTEVIGLSTSLQVLCTSARVDMGAIDYKGYIKPLDREYRYEVGSKYRGVYEGGEYNLDAELESKYWREAKEAVQDFSLSISEYEKVEALNETRSIRLRKECSLVLNSIKRRGKPNILDFERRWAGIEESMREALRKTKKEASEEPEEDPKIQEARNRWQDLQALFDSTQMVETDKEYIGNRLSSAKFHIELRKLEVAHEFLDEVADFLKEEARTVLDDVWRKPEQVFQKSTKFYLEQNAQVLKGERGFAKRFLDVLSGETS